MSDTQPEPIVVPVAPDPVVKIKTSGNLRRWRARVAAHRPAVHRIDPDAISPEGQFEVVRPEPWEMGS